MGTADHDPVYHLAGHWVESDSLRTADDSDQSGDHWCRCQGRQQRAGVLPGRYLRSGNGAGLWFFGTGGCAGRNDFWLIEFLSVVQFWNSGCFCHLVAGDVRCFHNRFQPLQGQQQCECQDRFRPLSFDLRLGSLFRFAGWCVCGSGFDLGFTDFCEYLQFRQLCWIAPAVPAGFGNGVAMADRGRGDRRSAQAGNVDGPGQASLWHPDFALCRLLWI